LHAPIALSLKGAVSFRRLPQPSAPCLLRFTTLALGLDRQSHARSQPKPPCHLAHMRNATMTRPQGHQSALRYAEQLALLAATDVCVVAFLILLRHPFSDTTCFTIPKKHQGKGCHCDSGRRPPTTHRTPGSAQPARKGIAPRGKLSLEIISGIKGAQPCHPIGRRLRFRLWISNAAPRIPNPLLRLELYYPMFEFTGGGTARRLSKHIAWQTLSWSNLRDCSALVYAALICAWQPILPVCFSKVTPHGDRHGCD
jgi:hypothetical protein